MKNMFFKKTILAALVAVLSLAALPVTSVFAQGVTPPKGEPKTEQLEKVWARQLTIYGKIVKVFDDNTAKLEKAQKLIDKAKANGKDVAAVQAALDAFKTAVEKSRPVYAGLKTLMTAHAGFDASGKVTDATQAKATVQSVRAKLEELHTSMDGTGKALHAAIQAFRDANKPASTPAPKGS